MPQAETSSLFIAVAILQLLCGCIFFSLRSSFPASIRGLSHWGLSCLAIAAAICLATLPDSLPLPIFSLPPDFLFVAGIMFAHTGLDHFEDHPPANPRQAGMAAATGMLLLWLAFVVDAPRLRTAVAGTICIALLLACAVSILKMRQKSFIELFTGASLVLAALFLFLLCLAAVAGPDARRAAIGAAIRLPYRDMLAAAMISMNIGFMLMASRRFQQYLKRIASRDGLTDAYTRTAYFDLAGKQIARARRSGEPLSLLMLDLDNFKRINDRHGHMTGDRVLVDFAQRVDRILRTQDIFGRYGGEEFSILLPNTPQADAYRVAARICRLLEEASVPGLPRYTVSIGTATMHRHKHFDLNAFVRHADEALYQAKNSGKNRVEVHESETLKFV